MLVCLCHPLDDRQLAELLDDGATSVEEIGRRCGAGTGCGACVGELADAVLAREAAGCAGPSLCGRLGQRGRDVVATPRASGGLFAVRARPPSLP